MDTKNKELLNKTLLNPKPVYINDTSARTSLTGHTIQVVAEAVIAAITYKNEPDSNSIVGDTLPAGIVLYLPGISTITLTSGTIVVYQE
jgi:hypothetical protein